MLVAPSPLDTQHHTGSLMTVRLLTCGSVDDGKSTLIGRLLVDAELAPKDQIEAVRTRSGEIDYSRLLDGLEAEREQSITIDVAYRYFRTESRSFVVADCPGHEQFTRNMATGASVCDLALLLVDASKGVRLQTRRHMTIAAMMGVRELVLAVNKMDLAGYDEEIFLAISNELRTHARQLGLDLTAIPVSALHGKNIVNRAAAMPWYGGPTVLEYLESVNPAPDALGPFRFAVQLVSRPSSDFRGYQGVVYRGRVKRGDPLIALPNGQTSRVARIVTFGGELDEAGPGEPVTLVLADEIEAGRGTVLAHPGDAPCVANSFTADLICIAGALSAPCDLLLRTKTRLISVRLAALRHRLDVVTLAHDRVNTLNVNDIGRVVITSDQPIVLEPYRDSRDLGAFLLIDRISNQTVAAGMVVEALQPRANLFWQSFDIRREDRPTTRNQVPAVVWLTGRSAAGKSTIVNEVERQLVVAGHNAYVLDGDNVRHGLNRDLGFTEAERQENVRRIAEVARILADAGLIALVAAISPYAADRANARAVAGDVAFYEVFVDTPIEICVQRDPKGLYRRALSGTLKGFTGIDSPYETPEAPDLRVRGAGSNPSEVAQAIIEFLAARGHLQTR